MAKRSYGTGQLYEKSGAYYGRWRTGTGRRLNRKVGRVRTPGEDDGLTRSQAEREFRRMQEAEEHAPRPEPGARVPTLDEITTSLRERLELRGTRKSYREACEYMQRVHITPHLGDRKITDIDTADVEAFGTALLKDGLASKSVRNILGFLHSVFEHGIDRGWLRENPARRAEKPRRGRTGANPDIQFLSVSELEAVIRAIPDEVVIRKPAPTRRGRPGPAPPPSPDVLGPVSRVVILTAAMTGLRQSELLGLRWRDVDWAAQRIRVRNTFVRGEHSTDGKSDLSTRRSVPLVQAHRIPQRRRSRVRPPTDRFAIGSLQAQQALQGCLPRRRRARGQVPRPAAHIRDTPRGIRAADADNPGVPRARRQQDDADLRALRAVRVRGTDGQRRLCSRHGESIPLPRRRRRRPMTSDQAVLNTSFTRRDQIGKVLGS
jgi:integrase